MAKCEVLGCNQPDFCIRQIGEKTRYLCEKHMDIYDELHSHWNRRKKKFQQDYQQLIMQQEMEEIAFLEPPADDAEKEG